MEHVYLTTVGSDVDADILESLLKSHGIETIRRYSGAGDYVKVLMGHTNLGVKLFVSPDDFPDAQNIIDRRNILIEQENEEAEESENEKNPAPKAELTSNFYLLTAILSGIAAAILFLYNMLR